MGPGSDAPTIALWTSIHVVARFKVNGVRLLSRTLPKHPRALHRQESVQAIMCKGFFGGR